MTENSYGAGIQCSGATLSISPFATTSVAVKRPQDYIFHTPVYNEATDSDGNLTNAGETFSCTQSYLEGDATAGSAPTVGTVGNFSDLTSTAAGSVGTAAVSLDNHTMTLSAGTGTGVVLTGQFVTDLTVD